MGVALFIMYTSETFIGDISPDTTSFLLTEVAIVQLACDRHVSSCDPLSLSLASLETAS